MLFQAATMLTVAFTASNFSSISMEPFHKGAGVASSFQSFLTTLLSSIVGTVIGTAFDQSTLPLTAGTLITGVATLLVVLDESQSVFGGFASRDWSGAEFGPGGGPPAGAPHGRRRPSIRRPCGEPTSGRGWDVCGCARPGRTSR
jgi:hypothetical protein